MTNPTIEDLEMSDIEYAQLVSKGYEPILKRQLIALGEDPDTARSLTRFVGLLQDKPPETDDIKSGELTMIKLRVVATSETR